MNDSARVPLRSVAVFGSGLVAMSAASAFARALPRAGVVLIATPPDPAALADRLPAILPASRAALALAGLEDAALLARGVASVRAGDRFKRWSRDGQVWVHPYGEAPGIPGGALHQHWLAARARGVTPPFHAYLPAGALAESGAVPQANDDDALLATIDPALRLDPDVAFPVFAEAAKVAGVHFARGSIASVHRRSDGGVASIGMAGGGTVTADLFVDCTGPGGLLAETAAGFEDWCAALPGDSLLLAEDDQHRSSSCDDYRAIDIGWRAQWPLATRTLTGLVFVSALTGEERARRLWGAGSDAATLLRFRPGRRTAFWTRNVLALGDAAVVAGPLCWTGLALAHAHLALVLELLPGRDMEPSLIAEYNRRAGLRADHLRDFLSACHVAGDRTSGAFWQAFQRSAYPRPVSDALAQFARRGSPPDRDEEMFSRESWVAMLVGSGIRPERPDPMAMSADPVAVAARLAALHAAVSALPRRQTLRR